MSEPTIRLELAETAEIVLNRPDKHNAMTAEMGEAIAEAVDTINRTPEVRVVLLRGMGRAFCAGGDFDLLEQNAASDPESTRRRMLVFYRTYLSVLRLRVPSIAVIHGAAVGAGLCLAAACDVRVAAENVKVGANFVRVGIHPGMGCTALLPWLVGPARAAELMLTGALLEAREAVTIGLVNYAVPEAELEGKVQEVARSISRGAPVAVAQTKATLVSPLIQALEAALEREAACQAISFTTADLREAVAAFRAGRPPNFVGR